MLENLSNKVILSEECYLKLLESHKFSEQFKNGMLFKKKRKQRTIFTKIQTDILESVFNKNEYITLEERSCLSKKLHISEKQVKIWFQNRRNKLKKINTCINANVNVSHNANADADADSDFDVIILYILFIFQKISSSDSNNSDNEESNIDSNEIENNLIT